MFLVSSSLVLFAITAGRDGNFSALGCSYSSCCSRLASIFLKPLEEWVQLAMSLVAMAVPTSRVA